MKTLLFALALTLAGYAGAANVPHSTSVTATPNENVSTQLPVWALEHANSARMWQLNTDSTGALRTSNAGVTGGAASAVSIIASVRLGVTITSVAAGVSMPVYVVPGGAAQAVSVISSVGLAVTVTGFTNVTLPVEITDGVNGIASLALVGATVANNVTALAAIGLNYGYNAGFSSSVPIYGQAHSVAFNSGFYALDTNTNIYGLNGAVISDTNAMPVEGSVTKTAMPRWTLLTVTNFSVTGPTVINLTATAGASGTMKYKFQAVGPAGGGTGIYWCAAPNATWIPPQGFFAVTATPIVDDYLAPGFHLDMSPTAAALTVTVQVEGYILSGVTP